MTVQCTIHTLRVQFVKHRTGTVYVGPLMEAYSCLGSIVITEAPTYVHVTVRHTASTHIQFNCAKDLQKVRGIKKTEQKARNV